MKAHGFKVHRLLSVIALAALAAGTGNTTTVAAEAGVGKAKPIQCACCWKRKDGYPPVHCVFLCDEAGMFDRIFFEPRSTALTPATKVILRKQAICLKRNDFGATLRGGADFHEVQSRQAAKLLAARRAAAVKKYLVSKGIPSSAIKTKLAWGVVDGQAIGGRTPNERRFNRYVRTKHGAPFK
ncbi:MAG: OmpA family protein [Alphaproteobacteria bacterium]|nr:OmpA family protein [Alphaproteobacteria bacterium]